MKFLILALIFWINQLAAAGPQDIQDIVVKARLDHASSHSLITKLRSYLVTSDLGDPFNYVLSKPLEIDLSEAMGQIPPDARVWASELQSVLRINFLESKYKMKVYGLGHSIDHFGTNLLPMSASQSRIEFVTINQVQGLKLKADAIVFEVELKSTNNRRPVTFGIEIIKPEFSLHPSFMMELPLMWNASVTPQDLLVILKSINMEKILREVSRNPDLVRFTVEETRIPDVSIQIGGKTLKLDKRKLKIFFLDHVEELKKGILDLMTTTLDERMGNVIKDEPQEFHAPKVYFLKTDINALFELQKLSTNSHDSVTASLAGDFCVSTFGTEETCKANPVKAKLRRQIDDKKFQASMVKLENFLADHQGNFALSLSENYLNQFVQASIREGMMERHFEGQKFKLGPEEAFLIADEAGKNFNLYLDILYDLSGAERVMVGMSQIRFPVKLKIDIKITEIDGYPHLQSTIQKIDTNNDLIFDGLPEYGLPSNVIRARFKKKVLKKIYQELEVFDGLMLIDILLLEKKNTFLEKIEFSSDGLGRATALLKLTDKGLKNYP